MDRKIGEKGMRTDKRIRARRPKPLIFTDGQIYREEGHAYKRTYMRMDETEVCIGRTINNGIFVEYLRS